MDSVRLDKWVWAARCFKTRSQATTACDAGRVEVNGTRGKPARAVKPGDLVEVRGEGWRRVLKVVALAERRGSAEAAQALYEDLTPPPPEPVVPPVVRDRGSGRPTKRDRRHLVRLDWDDL